MINALFSLSLFRKKHTQSIVIINYLAFDFRCYFAIFILVFFLYNHSLLVYVYIEQLKVILPNN